MNQQGEQTNKITYDAFGSTINGSIDEAIPFGYNNKIMDTDTNQYNYGYRDYTPTAGRFSTVDPIKDGTSWYNYCGNDPVNYVDLWGLCAESDNTYNITYYVNLPREGEESSSKGLDGGHVFVGLEKTNNDTGETEKTVVGFYPEPGQDGVLLKTLKGDVRSDENTSYDASYTLEIAKEQYENAIDYIETTDESPHDYNLYTYNCTDYAHDLGDAAGVEYPDVGLIGGFASNPYVSNNVMKFYYGEE